jgi:hypothetical protein
MALIQGSGSGGGTAYAKKKKEEKKPKTVTRGTAQAFSRSRQRSPAGEAIKSLQRELGYEPPPPARNIVKTGTGHRGDDRGGEAVMAEEMALARLERKLRQEEYGGTPLAYNLPTEKDTRKYGTDARLKQVGIKFVQDPITYQNPENEPIPEALKQVIYSAMMKVPYFAQKLQWRDGKTGNPIEIVIGKATLENDPGLTLAASVQGGTGSFSGLYGNLQSPLFQLIPGESRLKPTIHVQVPQSVLDLYKGGMRAVEAGKSKGTKKSIKNAKEFEKHLESFFKDSGNDTLLHEVGHHVDRYMKGLANTPEWEAIWEDPVARGSTTDYGKTLKAEMFAEEFQAYTDNKDTREGMDPRVRAFFDEFISPVLPQASGGNDQKTAASARELAKAAIRRYAEVRKAYKRYGNDIEAILRTLSPPDQLQFKPLEVKERGG